MCFYTVCLEILKMKNTVTSLINDFNKILLVRHRVELSTGQYSDYTCINQLGSILARLENPEDLLENPEDLLKFQEPSMHRSMKLMTQAK